uniref:Uncharacterized protein n=1 Tax=Fervidobacterium thailandense TaxID=1008305 RepID=A0A7C4GIG9_9BACT
MHVKILTQDTSKDKELEKVIRTYLLSYAEDKSVKALVAQTENAMMKIKPTTTTIPQQKQTTTPQPTQPQLQPTKGKWILKITAGNELAKTGAVYLKGQEKGKT